MKQNLAVIFGGKSTEHDISILTAIQVMSAVDRAKYNLFPVYITKEGEWFFGDDLLDTKFYSNFDERKLKRVSILPNSKFLHIKKLNRYKPFKKIDIAIIACHGKNGEDGTIQGLLELAGIPFQSSGVDGSAIGLDKILMKQIFQANDIPITQFVTLNRTDFKGEKSLKSILTKIELPVVVKPNRLGSSIGISVCETLDDLVKAIELAFLFDDKIIIEKKVEHLKEVNISVLGSGTNCVVSQTEEVQNKGFLSFEKKYLSNSTSKTETKKVCSNIEENKSNSNVAQNSGQKAGMQNMDRIIPANIPASQIKQIEKLAKKIFACLNSKGVVRIDFMIDQKAKKVYANEINTIPGSFAFYLWEKSNISFSNLIDKLVDIAKSDMIQKQKLTSTFSSTVLTRNQMDIRK